MTPIFIAVANCLHALASVIFVGHYLLLSLIYLPVLSHLGAEGAVALSDVSKRSRSWLYGSLLVFALSGIYLTVVDSNYLGIGDFSNPWAIIMLIKHILILAILVVGFWFNVILRVGQSMRGSSNPERAVAQFRRYCNWMAICGVLVMLLTAAAQAA
jgi:uncharacterized membrane protein